MNRRAVSPLLAVVVAIAVMVVFAISGCGSSEPVSTEEYANSVVSVRDRVDFALAQITVGEGTFEELIDRMEVAADRIDQAAADLEDVRAPEAFEDSTKQLVAAFHSLAGGLAGTAHDASQPGMEGLLTGANALQFPGWVKANDILADLAKQGVDVTPIGSH